MTDELTGTTTTPEEADTYHDQKAMMRISVYANRISTLFLALFIVVGMVIALFVWWYGSGRYTLDIFIAYLMYALGPFVLSGFFWIALQFVSEGIYLLLDIEDNTRRAKKEGLIS